MDGQDLDSNGFVIIAYLAMDCDNVTYAKCYVDTLVYLLALQMVVLFAVLQMLIFNCWYCNWWFIIGFGFVVVHP